MSNNIMEGNTAVKSFERQSSFDKSVNNNGVRSSDTSGGFYIFVSLSVWIYRTAVLLYDIAVFFLKTVGEYIRLAYRYVVPRKERSVAGEVALVTGSGHGIGRELALKLGSLGSIVICVDIDKENNRGTAAEIRARGGQAWAYQCDVSDREQVERLSAKVRDEVGDVNILINNAGVMVSKPFMQQTDVEIQKTVNVNLMGQLWVLRSFLPRMILIDHGSVVFMCGLPGHAGAPNMVPYSASKFAIRGMVEALYIELRQNHPGNKIHLMTVSPFIVETGMVKRPRVRFPSLIGIASPQKAADIIIMSMRRRAAVVYIPAIFLYLFAIVRLLPAKVQLLFTDFMDTGIGPQDD